MKISDGKYICDVSWLLLCSFEKFSQGNLNKVIKGKCKLKRKIFAKNIF